MDEEAAFRELDELEFGDAEDSIEIRNLITESKKRHLIYKYGDIEIRIRSGMNKDTREVVFEIQKIANDTAIPTIDVAEKIQKLTCIAVSKLCIDSPYTNPALWYRLDKTEGVIDRVLAEMLALTLEVDKRIQKFRKK